MFRKILIFSFLLILITIDYSNFARESTGNYYENAFGDKTRLAIPAMYGKVGDFHNGFAGVHYNKPTIYFLTSRQRIEYYIRNKMYIVVIDKNNRRINNGKYYGVSGFSKAGYAGVMNLALKGKEKSAVINRQGRIVYPFRSGEILRFYKGTAGIGLAPSRYAFLRRYGTRFRILPGRRYAMVHNFHDGLAQVQVYHHRHLVRLGFVNIYGKLVIPAKYEEATHFSEGLAAVSIAGHTHKFCYINKRGKIVIPERTCTSAYPFHSGLARIQLLRSGYIYINKSGRIAFNKKFDRAYDFSEGLALVEINDRFYYIDTKGRIALNGTSFKYMNGPFKEGFAYAINEDKKYGFINKKGEWVIPPQFEEARSFSDGVAAIKINGKWGFIAHP